MKWFLNKLFALFLIVCFVVGASVIPWFLYTDLWKYNANFEDYKSEFTLVKNYVTQEIQEKRQRRVIFLFGFRVGIQPQNTICSIQIKANT